MDEVWVYMDRKNREVLAFSSEEKLLQWAQEMNPDKKSLRLNTNVIGEVYTLLNHNSHIFPYNHRIYRLDLDTGEEVSIYWW